MIGFTGLVIFFFYLTLSPFLPGQYPYENRQQDIRMSPEIGRNAFTALYRQIQLKVSRQVLPLLLENGDNFRILRPAICRI